MQNSIAERIAAKRLELADLERRVEILRAEIAAYEDAMSLVGRVESLQRAGRNQRHRTIATRRERRISYAWLSILDDIGKEGENPVDLAEIAKLADKHGKDITAANIRSQMALFANRGIVERVRAGRYRLTHKGKHLVDTQLEQVANDATPHDPVR